MMKNNGKYYRRTTGGRICIHILFIGAAIYLFIYINKTLTNNTALRNVTYDNCDFTTVTVNSFLQAYALDEIDENLEVAEPKIAENLELASLKGNNKVIFIYFQF